MYCPSVPIFVGESRPPKTSSPSFTSELLPVRTTRPSNRRLEDGLAMIQSPSRNHSPIPHIVDAKDPTAPPAYDSYNASDHFHLGLPLTDSQRLSMEDKWRPLPEGSIRELDPYDVVVVSIWAKSGPFGRTL